jgi:hypothetical protein
MARWTALLGAVAAATALATMGIAGTFWSHGRSDARAAEAQARSLAIEFFRSQNERKYDVTCRLLSRGFITTHALRDRQTCTAVMRVVFVWSGRIDFRIGEVTREADRVVVHALADGAPGRLVFVREDGALRILTVQDG